jgi:hypothetical protein
MLDRIGPGGGRATTTLADLVEEYLELHPAAPVTIAKLRWLLGKSARVLGHKRLADLSPKMSMPGASPSRNLKGTDIRGASLDDTESSGDWFPRGLDLGRYLADLTPLQRKEVLVEANAFLDSLSRKQLSDFGLTPRETGEVRREAGSG